MKKLEDINNDVPIIKSTISLYKEYYKYSKLFCKKDQYVLGKQYEDYIISFLENLLIAVESPKEQKLKFLQAVRDIR